MPTSMHVLSTLSLLPLVVNQPTTMHHAALLAMGLNRPSMATDSSPSLSIPVVAPGKPAWKKVVACFGDGVLEPSGVINRAALGALIFQDESKRKLLNSCTHPFIQRTMLRQALAYFLKGVLSHCRQLVTHCLQ